MSAETFLAALIVLSSLGLINASYLLFKHIKKEPLVCPINKHDCNVVVESKYGSLFKIKNEYLGILYYLLIITCSLILFFIGFNLRIIIILNLILIISSLLSLIMSVFLVHIQHNVLKKYCFYCLISAAINLLIFLVIIKGF